VDANKILLIALSVWMMAVSTEFIAYILRLYSRNAILGVPNWFPLLLSVLSLFLAIGLFIIAIRR
jgi:hypothetical protein